MYLHNIIIINIIINIIIIGSDERVGLELAGLTDNQEEYGVFINHIIPNSPADTCKALQ